MVASRRAISPSRVKDNRQLPEDHPAARALGEMILAALQRNPLFISAALPLRIFPPLFNQYEGGQSFGSHVDNAIRQVAGTRFQDSHGPFGHALSQPARRVRRR